MFSDRDRRGPYGMGGPGMMGPMGPGPGLLPYSPYLINGEVEKDSTISTASDSNSESKAGPTHDSEVAGSEEKAAPVHAAALVTASSASKLNASAPVKSSSAVPFQPISAAAPDPAQVAAPLLRTTAPGIKPMTDFASSTVSPAAPLKAALPASALARATSPTTVPAHDGAPVARLASASAVPAVVPVSSSLH